MIRLPCACRGRTAVRFPANSADMCCVEVALKGFASAGKDLFYTGFPRSLTDGYAMLMSPSKGKTAVHGCHCPRDMDVSMREVMARPWFGVCVPQQECILCAHASPWASVCRFGAEECFVYTFRNSRLNFSPGIWAISIVFRLKDSLTSILICSDCSWPSLVIECRLLA